MPRIRLIHWNASEAAPRVETLRAAGYEVDYHRELRSWKSKSPDAFVIDLSRLPSHGREVATELRASKATRHVPIVFVEGLTEKVEAIRKLLPDATYSTWPRIAPALKKALAHPPASPVTPVRMMDRFASRTAAQKLGIQENTSVTLVDPPRNYKKVLGEIPAGVTLEEEPHIQSPVTLCFLHTPDDLPSLLLRARSLAAHTKLWIVWPKMGSQLSTGINQNVVRERAIDLGLVDYKICSVDATWTAMLFALKRQTKALPD